MEQLAGERGERAVLLALDPCPHIALEVARQADAGRMLAQQLMEFIVVHGGGVGLQGLTPRAAASLALFEKIL
jgi:hypothetical protein